MTFWQQLTSVCRHLSIDCREAARAQSEMIDHAVPPTRRLGVWLHVLVCKWCRRYGRQIRFLHEASQHNGEKLAEAAPGTLSEPARERIKQRLRDGV